MLHFRIGGGERLGWWMSEVVNVWGGERLGWWTSDFTQGVVNVWGGERLGWWKSDFTLGVVNVWGGECLILHWGWWTSGVVNVRVVNVLQSKKIRVFVLPGGGECEDRRIILHFFWNIEEHPLSVKWQILSFGRIQISKRSCFSNHVFPKSINSVFGILTLHEVFQ